MTFFRKIIAIMTFLLFAQGNFAGTMGNTSIDDYTGFYVGADIGLAGLVNSESSDYPYLSHQMSALGIVGGGLVGYDLSLFNRFKLGFEGFLNANGLNIADRAYYPPVSAYTVNASYNGGVRVLPGYELSSNIITHAILGYANAKFNIQDNGDYGYINQEMNKSGFQAGLGWKIGITPALWVRLDALYTIYNTIASTGGSNNPSYAFQVYNNQFNTVEGDLTLLYKFN
ncbi:MAG TPA: outer membrane beta-barrel protein [Legionellaceae bacterium]|nr:outer membrane beta-barrel protein [Legionellaceae bacterium]